MICSLRTVSYRAQQALVVLSILLCLAAHARSQQPQQTPRGPQLNRITPEAAAPGTRIKLDGLRLGANLDDRVQVLFAQGNAEYAAKADGAGYEADLELGPQALNVVVPPELQPGPSLVTVEVEGQRSASMPLKINAPATAVVLKNLRPPIAQPGEMLWIDGTGFSDSDDFELINALGKARHLGNGQGTSDADVAAFRLPSDLPAGETRVRVTEHRSGSNQVSNTLSFTVVRGPAPLDIMTDDMEPVSPGQWLDLMVTSELPIKDAERVEVAFQQKDQFLTVSIDKPKRLRVQVPSVLSAGNVQIQTRTWVAGEASVWSSPVGFLLLDTPAVAKTYSINIRAVRAEAAFKQGDRIVATTSVSDSDYPRVRVPTEKLSPGTVDVLTRVWRGGQPSPWLFKHYGFSWPSEFLPDGTMGEVPFMDGINLGSNTKRPLVVYPGEGLILGGTFPVESADKLQVVLESVGHLSVQVDPISLEDPRSVRINLPDDLEAGDWDVVVSNDMRAAKLPIKLRLVRVGNTSSKGKE